MTTRRVVSRGVFSGSDCPHRLVRDEDVRNLRRLYAGKAGTKLPEDDDIGFARLPLLEFFPDAQNRRQSGAERGDDFFPRLLIRPVEHMATFGGYYQLLMGTSRPRHR